MTIDRTTILKGPCLLIWQGNTIYSKGDVTIAPQKQLWDVATSAFGKRTDRRLKDAFYKVSFQQDGEVTAAMLAAIYLYSTTIPGTSIFGAGTPLYVLSLTETANNYITMRSAAVTKIPDANFRTDQTLFGAIEFTCLGANNVAFNDANRFLTVTTKKASGAVTATTNASPDVITSNGHGLANGDPISISGVTGDLAVNINGYVCAVSTNTFEISTTADGLNPVAGTGAYVSGGTWTLGWPLVIANAIASPFTGTWATAIPTGSISSTSEATPDVVTTSAAHGLKVNDRVTISGDTGDTAINGTWYVLTVPTTASFTVSATQGGAAVAGAGSAGSGGTFTRANALDSFDTEEGIQVSFALDLTPKRSNNMGTYDMLFSSLTVTAKGLPIGPTLLDILAAVNLQGTGVQLGQSMTAEGQNLKLAGSGIYFWLYGASINANQSLYSAEKLRVGDFQWEATRTFTGNAQNPLYKISTSPISS